MSLKSIFSRMNIGRFIASITVVFVLSLVFQNWYISIPASLVTMIMLDLSFSYLKKHLSKRADAEAPIYWDILVADKKIGQISDSLYASFLLNALNRQSNYIKQAHNLLKTFSNMVTKLLIALPVFVIWLLLIKGIFVPDQVVAMIAHINSFTAGDVKHYADLALIISWTVFLLTVIFEMAFSKYPFKVFGYENVLSLKSTITLKKS